MFLFDKAGGTVARLHGYSYAPVDPAEPVDVGTPGRDNEPFFKRMDRAIVEAKRRNIRLSVSIINAAPHYHHDPEEHFGMHVPAFVHHVNSAEEIDDFYDNEECIQLYKDWVSELLTRENHITGVEYRDDPTIMLWELGNEVEYHEGWNRDDGPSIRSWVEAVAPHVQDVMKGNQLVTTGEHGWPYGRNDFLNDHRPDSVDVCSIHFWPGPGHYDLPDDETAALFDELVTKAHDTLEKPLWIGEYCWSPPDGEPVDEEFMTERNEKLHEWHSWMDEADVAGATLHTLRSKKINEEIFGNEDRPQGAVFGDADTGTVEELRRYARRVREKSTASADPKLLPME